MLIVNNGLLSLIRQNQKYALDFRYAVDLWYDGYNLDVAAISKGFGCHAGRIQHPDEIRPAFQRAVDSGKPSVIDIIVDQETDAAMGPALDAIKEFDWLDFITLERWIQMKSQFLWERPPGRDASNRVQEHSPTNVTKSRNLRINIRKGIIMAKRNAILIPGFHSISLEDVKSRHGDPPWNECVVSTDEMRGVLICQSPGHPNDKHYHNHDEWWVVMEGEIHWEMEGQAEPVKAKAGDFVFAPKRHFHHIHVKGDKPAIRLAISVAGERHLHDK